MCRWNAYVGQPLVLGELLFRTLEVPESTGLVLDGGELRKVDFSPRAG